MSMRTPLGECGCLLRCIDDKSDDNADDSCPPNYVHNGTPRLLNSLYSDPACFWQCGGQGFESP
jgi:hypothetical protein